MKQKHIFRRLSFYSVLSFLAAIALIFAAIEEMKVSSFFNGAVAIEHMSPIVSLYLSTITFLILKGNKHNLFALAAPVPFFIMCVICVEIYYHRTFYGMTEDLFTKRYPIWIFPLLLSCLVSLLLYRFFLRYIADR